LAEFDQISEQLENFSMGSKAFFLHFLEREKIEEVERMERTRI